MLLSLLSLLLLLSACSSGGDSTGNGGSSSSATNAASGGEASGGGDAGGPPLPPIGGDRPVTLNVPLSYKRGIAVPLVIMLHGSGASGVYEELYLRISSESELRGFIYAYPDGTKDKSGLSFWNATDACCDFDGSKVDDSGYLSSVIKEIEARYTIDPKRVVLIGHSNGGFMAYRMACDHADQIAGVASLAGAMYADASKCAPSGPVSVLDIHGTADATVLYDGGAIAGIPYPSAKQTVTDWTTLDACKATPESGALDIERDLPGAETAITRYGACAAGAAVEQWTIQGGSHLPNIDPSFTPKVLDFLLSHPKP
jgi:polyhydroxybutyrate depolymerase